MGSETGSPSYISTIISMLGLFFCSEHWVKKFPPKRPYNLSGYTGHILEDRDPQNYYHINLKLNAFLQLFTYLCSQNQHEHEYHMTLNAYSSLQLIIIIGCICHHKK
jgi:hypothetical protein